MEKWRLGLLRKQKQFAFIDRVVDRYGPIDPAQARKIQVERLDGNVLNCVGHIDEYRANFRWEDTLSFTLYWGVYGDSVVLLDYSYQYESYDGASENTRALPIGEQLAVKRLVGETDPDFIVRIEASWEHDDGMSYVWTIYPTRQFDFNRHWIRQIDKAAAALKAELEAACQMGGAE